MRGAFLTFLAVGLVVAGFFASAAFARTSATRSLTVVLVSDHEALVSLAANPTGAHRCFVTNGTSVASGKLAVRFGPTTGCPDPGAGTGVNAGGGSKYARYAFHDLLVAKNLGQRTVLLWVNATTSSPSPSLVDVALESAAGQMAESDYVVATTSPLTLAPLSSAWIGIRVNATLSAGSTLQGAVVVEARS